jgi:hypothetical protein
MGAPPSELSHKCVQELLWRKTEKIYATILKFELTKGRETAILNKQNKEGWMHPPHLPPTGKEVHTVIKPLCGLLAAAPHIAAGRLASEDCADAREWYPRFVF